MKLIRQAGWFAVVTWVASHSWADKQVFWGDLHVHTGFSMDAYVWHNPVTPAQAYRFAQGQPLQTPLGVTRQLRRPLDFAAVTDHAEYFAVMYDCQVATGSERYRSQACQMLRVAAVEDSPRGFREIFLPAILAEDPLCDAQQCAASSHRLWQRTIEAAQNAYRPGRFTTFVANEWTASPDNLHWHRNLIYANVQVPAAPINAFDQPHQEDLWRALQTQCVEANDGCDVVAIPHNGNIGMGGAFNVQAHDNATLALRARFEKLVEIHQHKGASECYPQSVLSDEHCAFEFMLPIPLQQELRQKPRALSQAEHQQIGAGYTRDVLAQGLMLRSTRGINPFVYGFIGSTDTHAGRPGDVDEAAWAGAIGSFDEPAGRRAGFVQYNPGGLAAVWASQNTRESIFAALKRRETYATSGPRIGLQLEASDEGITCDGEQTATVVMGGQYVARKTPTFRVRVWQDERALQRIDLIRLQLKDGVIQQHIESFTADQAGRAEWCVTWHDETYAASLPTLWYARVLEVPSLRWDGQTQIQERAWSSPIWSASGF